MGLARRRANPLRTLRLALQKVRIPKINKLDKTKESAFEGNTLLINSTSLITMPSVSVDALKKTESTNKELLLNEILMSTMYKVIAGLKIRVAGRLNRRAIAARSVIKTGQVGSLKNFKSSYEGLSAVTLRGHERPNLVKSSFSSKTRNGSFNVSV